MSALINHKIEKNNYELVRDKIGAILFLELNNQYVNYYTPEADVESVTVERTNPEDFTELSSVNVSISEDSFDNKHQGQVDGSVIYLVDAYVKSKSDPSGGGDVKAQFKVQRLLGIIRAILEDPQYKTLGYTIPFIKRVMVSRVEIRGGTPADAANTAMGRLTLSVEMIENTQLLEGVDLESAITSVKLGISDFGYLYQFNTTDGPTPDARYVKIVDQYGNVLALLEGGDIYTVTRIKSIVDDIFNNQITITDNILSE